MNFNKIIIESEAVILLKNNYNYHLKINNNNMTLMKIN